MNEAYLPGIGTKFWLNLAGGEKLTVIRHNTGRYELYFFKQGEEFPSESLTMTENEARDVGSVLFGRAEHKVVETMDVVMRDLVIEWAMVEPGAALADKSIKELEIRKKTGVSIVAIIRGSKGIPSPQPDEAIRAGDLLLMIGKREQIEAIKSSML